MLPPEPGEVFQIRGGGALRPPLDTKRPGGVRREIPGNRAMGTGAAPRGRSPSGSVSYGGMIYGL